jgi:hypothetical protein
MVRRRVHTDGIGVHSRLSREPSLIDEDGDQHTSEYRIINLVKNTGRLCTSPNRQIFKSCKARKLNSFLSLSRAGSLDVRPNPIGSQLVRR